MSSRDAFLDQFALVLGQLLTNLKHKVVATQAVAAECLYRLIWVYCVRIKGENPAVALARLRSIFDAILPATGRTVPPDLPHNFFVQIISVVAVSYPEFALGHALSVLQAESTSKYMAAEKNMIAIRAFLLIVDRLDRREPAPSFLLPAAFNIRADTKPRSAEPMAVDFAPLSEETIIKLRLEKQVHEFRGYLTRIWHAIDLHAVRGSLMTSDSKPAEDLLTPERKRLMELLLTFLYVFPRFYPLEPNSVELIDFLCRCTLHVDADVQRVARMHLANMTAVISIHREVILTTYLQFYSKHVWNQHALQLVNTGLRVMISVIDCWQNAINAKNEGGMVENSIVDNKNSEGTSAGVALVDTAAETLRDFHSQVLYPLPPSLVL